LRVERGVPVTFSIQARHDVAFCITSDPTGGVASINETKNYLCGWRRSPWGTCKSFGANVENRLKHT